jgi:COMPASS component SWD3
LVHEDNAPVTTVRFSPNGRYILAFTLDSCIRLWDYVAGTCKKTYQGHVNTKYSLGGAFGIGGTEGFIVSGSENGDILFWDVRTKDIVQTVSGHDGVVCWVDTSPGRSGSGTVVSGGLDGTVRIWVDVHEDRDNLVNGLKFDSGADTFPHDDVDMDMEMVGVKVEREDAGYGHDTPRHEMSDNEERSPKPGPEDDSRRPSPNLMEEE